MPYTRLLLSGISAGLGERLLAELVVPYMRRFVDVYVEELLRSLKGRLDATL